MTINYKNGKIYKIEPTVDHDEGDVYIGSTTKEYLSQRMVYHRKDYKKFKNAKKSKTTAFNLFDKYGIDNCDIILLESVEANSKDELHQREAHYIKTIKCVNKYIPLRTSKEYRQDNKEQIKERNKQYRQNNKDVILERQRLYRNANKEMISEKRKEKFICDCGSTVVKDRKAKHLRTLKHINFCKQSEEIKI